MEQPQAQQQPPPTSPPSSAPSSEPQAATQTPAPTQARAPPMPVPMPQHNSVNMSAPAPPAPQTGGVPLPLAPGPGAAAGAPTGAPRRTQPAVPGVGALEGDSLHAFMLRMDRHGQQLLDRVAPYTLYRWCGLVALLLIFMLRMYLLEGFYIVTYVLFIFILNQFILFLQPKDRAALLRKARAAMSGGSTTTDTSNNEPSSAEQALPTSADDEEFRPFVRRLPEFKFWYSTTYATVLAFCATFFKVFDVPVFWPLLLFYFILLFVATMRRQWLDMKRLKYVPWDIGSKKVYKSDPKRVSVSVNRANGPAPGGAAIVNASGRAPPPVPTVQLPKRPTSPAQDAPDLR